MSIRILVSADLHLGRRPSGLPGPVSGELGQKVAHCSSAQVWQRIVERAIRENVDLVLLAGDVVDQDNRFFESLGPLEQGLSRLHQAGIPVYAVAGNHDWDTLATMADLLAKRGIPLHLLGRNGQWEKAIFRSRQDEPIRIVGWSFPHPYVSQSPLEGLEALGRPTPSDPDADLPTIGLLHGDLDGVNSQYAPVSRRELEAGPVALWVLGHLHAPEYHPPQAGAGILVPGSPQGLDPTETGAHGPWLVELEGRSARTAQVRLTHWPLAPLRYEVCQVDISDLENAAEPDVSALIRERIHAQMTEQLKHIHRDRFAPEVVLVQLTLVGVTPFYSQLEKWLAEKAGEDIQRYESSYEAVTARIIRIENQTRPALDLDQLAQSRNLLGRLARLILYLQELEGNPLSQESLPTDAEGIGDIQTLFGEAAKLVQKVRSKYSMLQENQEGGIPYLIGIVRQQAYRLSEALAMQRHSP